MNPPRISPTSTMGSHLFPLAAVLWGAVACAQAPSPPAAARVDSLLDAVVAEHGIPGLAVAVVRSDTVLVAEARGVRRAGRPERVEVADPFHLGSVSKPITATMLGALVEEGVLRWDTTVGEAFVGDEVHPALLDVTLVMLLQHRAGIAPFEQDEEWAVVDPPLVGLPLARRQAFAAWLLRQPPGAPPGTEHVYSNGGYTVAAAMAERATGQAWEVLVRERVFEALGMATAGFGWPARSHPDAPWGHEWEGDETVPQDPHGDYQLEALAIGPAGDIHASVLDLARFGQAHLRGLLGQADLLAPATVRRLHDAPVGEYALGWNVRSFGDHHLGSAGTFFATVIVSPEDDLVYAFVTNVNADAGLPSALISGLRRIFVGPPSQ